MDHTFCGWYFRCQSDTDTLALIPAMHATHGERSGSLQIISDTGSHLVPFSREDVWVSTNRSRAELGKNVFREDGIRLDVNTQELTAKGELRFGPPTPIRYHIMGPFRYVPCMECCHTVISMRHTVSGDLRINGKDYRFRNDIGYIEGDRGRSFPKNYVWTQCFFEEGSLMLSVAKIPFGPIGFTGIIGIIHLRGREYRFATYLGAKTEKIGDREIVIRQGALSLTAKLLEKNAYFLKAPKSGDMIRNIRENAACRAKYRFSIGKRTILDFETPNAAFEYEYPVS